MSTKDKVKSYWWGILLLVAIVAGAINGLATDNTSPSTTKFNNLRQLHHNLSTVVAAGGAGSGSVASLSANFVANGGFERWDTGAAAPAQWVIYDNPGDSTIFTAMTSSSVPPGEQSTKSLTVSVQKQPGNAAGTRIEVYNGQMPSSIVSGRTYTLSFWAKANSIFNAPTVNVIKNTPAYGSYGLQGQNISMTTSWTKFSYTFTANTTATDARIDFYLPAGLYGSPNIYWLDNVQLEAGSVATGYRDNYALINGSWQIAPPILGNATSHIHALAAGALPLTGGTMTGAIKGGKQATFGNVTCTPYGDGSHLTGLAAAPVSSVFGRTGAVTAQSGDYTAAQVGLGNVTNDAQVKRTEMGAASGVATLNASSLVVQNPMNATTTPAANMIPMAYNTNKIDVGWLPTGVAWGVAQLDANSLVQQNPANMTSTPTAWKIPQADGSGKLDGWITSPTTTCLPLAGGTMTGAIKGGKQATFGNTSTTNQYVSGSLKAGSLAGILKGTSGTLGTATAGTDYVAPSTTVNGHALSSNVTVTASDVGLGSVTNDAQLKRAAGDINSFSAKTTPVGADIILIEDSANSYAKAKATMNTIAFDHTKGTNIGTNTHAQIDTFISSKAAASGLASLDAGSLVVQNPTNATATPTASKIPIADANGKLDGWTTKSLASITAESSISNSASETQVVGGTIPANMMLAGTTFRIRAHGILSTTSSAPTCTWRARIGTSSLSGNIATSVAPTAGASLASQPVSIDILITVRINGSSGTVLGNGYAIGSIGASNAFTFLGTGTTATVAVDTTAQKIIELTFQFGTANSSNTLKTENAVIEVVKI